MKITNVTIVNVDNVPLTPDARLVYETLLKTGVRSTRELKQHLDMDNIELMLAVLLRYDLVEVTV
jgi:hypothetical protein